MNDRRPLFLGITRVSTRRQVEEGHSLPQQEETLRAWADARGVDLEVVVAAGRTGKRKSPELKSAVGRLNRRDADGLVATKLDRVARSVIHFSEIMADAQANGWDLIVLAGGFDLRTKEGRAMAHMLATFAQYERELLSERITEGLDHAKRHGTKTGGRIGAPRGITPELAAVVADAHREAWPRTHAATAELLNARGVPSATGGRWHGSSVGIALMRARGTN